MQFLFVNFNSSLTDMPSKTATGTIAIQVEDFNDHCPTLTSKVQTLCTDKQVVLVTAVDEDADPNGAPFTFNVVQDKTKGKWVVEHLNGMCPNGLLAHTVDFMNKKNTKNDRSVDTDVKHVCVFIRHHCHLKGPREVVAWRV